MFRPRHAYRSPITNRYRGKAKGCPVFNNLNDITSSMVEEHDECLECLAKIKNRNDLYRTLAENNKPSNNVIKSLQRLSSSASNNRLKTCLQFLIIKVNEKTTKTTQQANLPQCTPTTIITNGTGGNCHYSTRGSGCSSPKSYTEHINTPISSSKHQNKKPKLAFESQQKPHESELQKLEQLPSPSKEQVTSTQDQDGPGHDDHDCQTSPSILIPTQSQNDSPKTTDEPPQDDSPTIRDDDEPRESSSIGQSSPEINYAPTTTVSTTTSTSPSRIEIHSVSATLKTSKDAGGATQNGTTFDAKSNAKVTQYDHDTSSTASWESSYTSPHSPISTSSTTSQASSSCSSSMTSSPPQTLSPSPLSSPDNINELRGPRLKLSEQKIRKIKQRPVLFEDDYHDSSFASTPTTSSGCSPGQHSNTTQNSDNTRLGNISATNTVIHTFQAPAKFVNYLKPCNLPTQCPEPPQAKTPPVPTNEMFNCAICGIKDKPPNISKVHGQHSCILCTRFFAAFLKKPQQLFCSQDGDCFMTFDSRCQACWIKICLQKFDIEEEHRKIGRKFSPKLLSSPNVSLITIDTSLPRQ